MSFSQVTHKDCARGGDFSRRISVTRPSSQLRHCMRCLITCLALHLVESRGYPPLLPSSIRHFPWPKMTVYRGSERDLDVVSGGFLRLDVVGNPSCCATQRLSAFVPGYNEVIRRAMHAPLGPSLSAAQLHLHITDGIITSSACVDQNSVADHVNSCFTAGIWQQAVSNSYYLERLSGDHGLLSQRYPTSTCS